MKLVQNRKFSWVLRFSVMLLIQAVLTVNTVWASLDSNTLAPRLAVNIESFKEKIAVSRITLDKYLQKEEKRRVRAEKRQREKLERKKEAAELKGEYEKYKKYTIGDLRKKLKLGKEILVSNFQIVPGIGNIRAAVIGNEVLLRSQNATLWLTFRYDGTEIFIGGKKFYRIENENVLVDDDNYENRIKLEQVGNRLILDLDKITGNKDIDRFFGRKKQKATTELSEGLIKDRIPDTPEELLGLLLEQAI
ncbi:MAG: hypothetical protein GY853_03300 [PVC group bacterium]|nr:hypothetical protein [PVC group bacterium]